MNPLNAWWTLALIGGWTLICFFGGVYVEHKFNEAEQEIAVKAQKIADDAEIARQQKRAAGAEDDLASERTRSSQLAKQWSSIVAEKNHVNCPHSPAVIRLLKSATGAN